MRAHFDINLRSQKPILLTIERDAVRINLELDCLEAESIADNLNYAIQDLWRQVEESHKV